MKKTGSKPSKSVLADLGSRSPKVRHRAAIRIMASKTPGGKPALVRAISNPRNIGYTGTLVYALSAFECGDLFGFFIDLVIFGSFEVRSLALMALKDKTFTPTQAEIDFAKVKIAFLKGEEFGIDEKEKLVYSLERIIRKISRSSASVKRER